MACDLVVGTGTSKVASLGGGMQCLKYLASTMGYHGEPLLGSVCGGGGCQPLIHVPRHHPVDGQRATAQVGSGSHQSCPALFQVWDGC